jgi:hypothetical protein
MWLKADPTQGRKATESGLLLGRAMLIESPVNLLPAVAILPESVPQKHQLTMEAVLITQRSSSVNQCGKYCMLDRWVVITRVEIEVSMGRLKVYLMAQKAITSPVNIVT